MTTEKSYATEEEAEAFAEDTACVTPSETDIARAAAVLDESTEFQCCMCDGIFTKGRSDDEAMAEALDRWDAEDLVPDADPLVVCEDCHVKMGFPPSE